MGEGSEVTEVTEVSLIDGLIGLNAGRKCVNTFDDPVGRFQTFHTQGFRRREIPGSAGEEPDELSRRRPSLTFPLAAHGAASRFD